MEAVWRERAGRLSQRPDFAEGEKGKLPVMVLGIGKERYGVDLPDVAEVLPLVRATPVPGAALVFAGVINVHGEIRPVFDLRRLLGMEMVQNAAPSRVILLRKAGREAGLQIDSVEQIVWIGPGDLESAEDGDAASSQRIPSKYIKRTAKGLLRLLSTEAVLGGLNT